MEASANELSYLKSSSEGCLSTEAARLGGLGEARSGGLGEARLGGLGRRAWED